MLHHQYAREFRLSPSKAQQVLWYYLRGKQNRAQWLQSQGFKVLRFWNNEVLVNTEAVLEIVMKHL